MAVYTVEAGYSDSDRDIGTDVHNSALCKSIKIH